MRIVRSIAAFLVGYLISFVSSVFWFFRLTHHDPWNPASARFFLATAVFAIVFALLAGYLAALIAGDAAHGVGRAIALFIALVAFWSWFETPGRSHWAQLVAALLMAPAVLAGTALRLRSAPLASRQAL